MAKYNIKLFTITTVVLKVKTSQLGNHGLAVSCRLTTKILGI